MIGIDTNILIYARVASAPLRAKAVAFLEQCAAEPDVVLAELVLVELYLALRNPAILAPPLDAASAAAECQHLRSHPLGPSWSRRRSWAPCGRMQPLRGSLAAALSMSGSRARFRPTAWRISPRSTNGTSKASDLGGFGTRWLDQYWPQSSPID